MRILWLADERHMRVCDFWGPLPAALSKLTEVEVVRRKLDMLEGKFCHATTMQGRRLRPLLTPAYANTFDWVITDAMWSFLSEPWDHITAHKAILWADNHGPMVARYVGFAHAAAFDLFLPMYRDGASRFHSYLDPAKVMWLPFWLNEEVYVDYGLNKDIPILQTGVVHPRVYPLRQRVFDALQREPYFKRIQRPVENMEGKYWPVGRDYARVLNRAWISTACTSCYHYSLSKLFEIPAANSVLACDWIPEMADLGFEPGANFLLLTQDMNLRAWAKRWLAPGQRDELQRISRAGYDLMHSRHTATRRAAELLDVLTERKA